MMASSAANMVQTIKLLDVSADENGEADIRILLDDKHIKYLFIEEGIFNCQDIAFEPILVSIIPALPRTNWQNGLITRRDAASPPTFVPSIEQDLSAIQSTWHASCIEFLDLRIEQKHRPNVCTVFHPTLGKNVILKYARFSWEIPQLDDETWAYSCIDGVRFAPRFLGHVTEHGRVIGFVIEKLEDARRAGPQDLELCQQPLSQLHKLGFLHGDVNRHNILISRNRAILIDFENLQRCEDPSRLSHEYESLAQALADTSGKGGVRTRNNAVQH